MTDITVDAEFERNITVRVVLRRIINTRSAHIDRLIENYSVLMQLLQRQITMMERYETNDAYVAFTGSI